MQTFLIAAVAFLVGAIAAYAWVSRGLGRAKADLQTAREERAVAEARGAAAQEQVKQLQEDREGLKESFTALAAEQLKSSRDEFLKQAGERFEKSEQKQAGELEKRHEAIEKEFKALGETVKNFEQMHGEIEKQRTEDFTAMREQVLSLRSQTAELGESSTQLSIALKGSSQSRGKWGELALRNICEAAGMTEHCDFLEQSSDESGKRPDLIVNLPGDGMIPIDAKVPYADYERMIEETDPEQRKALARKHGEVMRTTMLDLAKRNYPAQLGAETDFTVMFVPIESVVSAAFEARPDLQQEAIDHRILIVTPVTLIALLRTVGVYWKQEKLARNAQEIWQAARDLHSRIQTFQGHLAKAGRGLEGAVRQFNSAMGSYEARVLPAGRRVEELSGIEAGKTLEDPVRVESQVRELPDPDPQED
ncbi:MAG: DNA recombination protein RmuC [Myxococcota bacterium]|nr:DNA recombination protein RmuC [Myxococcota bacterium]